jgi:GxxExxY protein
MTQRGKIDRLDLLHADLTERLIGGFFSVYNTLGHGFLESVYEEATTIVLSCIGLRVERQVPLTVYFRGIAVGTFKADLIVESSIVVEIKASRTIDSAHEAQLLNYLRASKLEVGLVMNFGAHPQFKRLVCSNHYEAAKEPL